MPVTTDQQDLLHLTGSGKMLKTIVKKDSGKEVCCIEESKEVHISDDECFIDEIRTTPMGEPYFNFHTREFFDKGAIKKKFGTVKPVYLRVSLSHFGLLDIIEKTLQNPANKEAMIYFEYALSFERDDKMINDFAQAFGLSSSQVDDIFEYAESIQK